MADAKAGPVDTKQPAEQMSETEQRALAPTGAAFMGMAVSDVDLGAIRSLGDTEAGEEATPIEQIEDPFLIVSAYTTPVTWPAAEEGGVEREGFTTHILALIDPNNPAKLTEVYSNSDYVAGKIQALVEKDNLSPERPVLVRFSEIPTRRNRVHKLTNPTKGEVQNFQLALKAAIEAGK